MKHFFHFPFRAEDGKTNESNICFSIFSENGINNILTRFGFLGARLLLIFLQFRSLLVILFETIGRVDLVRKNRNEAHLLIFCSFLCQHLFNKCKLKISDFLSCVLLFIKSFCFYLFIH